MIFAPKKGKLVMVTKYLGDGYLHIGSQCCPSDVVKYANPAMAGLYSIKLFDKWYHPGDYRKITIIDKIKCEIDRIKEHIWIFKLHGGLFK